MKAGRRVLYRKRGGSLSLFPLQPERTFRSSLFLFFSMLCRRCSLQDAHIRGWTVTRPYTFWHVSNKRPFSPSCEITGEPVLTFLPFCLWNKISIFDPGKILLFLTLVHLYTLRHWERRKQIFLFRSFINAWKRTVFTSLWSLTDFESEEKQTFYLSFSCCSQFRLHMNFPFLVVWTQQEETSLQWGNIPFQQIRK